MTIADEQEIARYVERVRQSLADLPPAVRDDLMEDLPEHLAEVAAEGSGSLVDRVGPPEAYAAELRAAAGVGAPSRAPNLDDRISAAALKVRGRLRALDAKAGPVIGYAKASDFLRLLRPGWWVLRGYLAAMFITVALTGQPFGLLPRLGGSTLAAVLLLAVTVVGSIWVGRRTGGFTRWPRLAVNVATVLLFIFGVAGFLTADQRGLFSSGHDYQPTYNDNPYANVQDVYVYDQEGRLVDGARLFDQNGEPIHLGYPWCTEAQEMLGDPSGRIPGPPPVRQPYPYCPQGAPFPVPAPGSPTPAPTASATPTVAPTPTPQSATTPSPLPSPT
jgi:hypothetical protein